MFKLPQLENWRDALALSLLIIGLQQMASTGYINGKAYMAQYLIGQSWERSLSDGGSPENPWPWSDTWPVARLLVPGQSVDLYVLAGSSGHALAFGPGYEMASAALGEPGISVIGGHRDTHFAFLQDVRRGSQLRVQLPTGRVLSYRVENLRIVDTALEPEVPVDGGAGGGELWLVTCYPFDAIAAGGPLRYVVQARLDTAGDTQGQPVVYAL